MAGAVPFAVVGAEPPSVEAIIGQIQAQLGGDWPAAGPDGVKADRDGRLYVAAGLNQSHTPYESAAKFKGGVYILSPEGKLLDFVAIPVDEVTNCAFGGPDWKTLYITAGGTLWSIPVTTPGWVPAAKR